MFVQGIIDAVAPWKDLYGNSPVVSTAVTTVHVVALLFGGGFALAADRSTLRALRGDGDDRQRHLGELHAVHRPVLIALTLLFISGVALALADLETFLGSPTFWIKLSLVALLLINGAVLARTEARLLDADAPRDAAAPLWRRLRASTFASIALWTLTTIAGTALVGLS